jgi:DNA-cytosine methyltransferase
MNVLSLFDGISCGQVALERAGVSINQYFASEIEPTAIKITQNNHPATIQIGDVTKVRGADLPKIDLLMGGSPCQGFSFAGKGLNFDDPRSKLFFEFVRLRDETNPEFWLLENVKMKKAHQDVISSYLGVQPIEINSEEFSAQSRKRLYWTNIPIGEWNGRKEPLSSVLEENVDPKYFVPRTRADAYQGGNQLTPHYKSQANTIHDVNRRAPCLCAMTHGYSYGYIPDGDSFRKLTPVEWERLQTLPDGYTEGVSDTKRYHALGNGWTVDVIAFIFTGIKESQKNTETL